MAKKTEKFGKVVSDFLFDAICISCFMAGFCCFFFLFMEAFFEGSINFMRRNIYALFVFAIMSGVVYSAGKIWWKHYQRKLRRAQKEFEMRKARLSKMREEADENV